MAQRLRPCTRSGARTVQRVRTRSLTTRRLAAFEFSQPRARERQPHNAQRPALLRPPATRAWQHTGRDLATLTVEPEVCKLFGARRHERSQVTILTVRNDIPRIATQHAIPSERRAALYRAARVRLRGRTRAC